MSHTVHWSSSSKEFLLQNYGSSKHKYYEQHIGNLYRDKLGHPTSSLSLQADVLYPNALASVTQLFHQQNLFGSVETVRVPRELTGCKGHQIDCPFPLEPRVPVTLPLVQYPTATDNIKEAHEHDACSVPVLNWEKYIKAFRNRIRLGYANSVASIRRRRKPTRRPGSRNAKRELKLAKERVKFCYERARDAEFDKLTKKLDVDEKKNQLTENESVDLQENEDSDADENVDQDGYISPVSSEEEYDATNEDVNEARKSLVKNLVKTIEEFHKDKARPKAGMARVRDAIKRSLYDSYHIDIEKKEHDLNILANKKDPKKELYKKLIRHVRIEDLNCKGDEMKRFQRLPLNTLRAYTKQPAYKVMGTWNYFFNGHGTCDWIRDAYDPSKRNIIVGCGTKLRMAALKRSTPTQMLSYTIESMWEEDTFPSNVRPGRTTANEEMSDLIVQIVSARKGRLDDNIAAVRRGRSVEIYRFDGKPSLVTSVGNVCYGTNRYRAYEMYSSLPIQRNPLLVSFDLNPWFPEELVMRDENNILSFIDFAGGRTTYQTWPLREVEKNFSVVRQKGYPEFHLNEACGVTYANHPRTCYSWANSHIYFHDYRTNLNSPTSCVELLDLKTNDFARTWSEQETFYQEAKSQVEAVSMVKQSEFSSSTYYHVATTERLLLMDMRVPHNPVIKLDHGLKTPPAYLDTVRNDDFEVVVAGSQRYPEVFSALYDTTHVSCTERVDCTDRNPVLYSSPRHLLCPPDFFHFVEEKGCCPAFETDYRKAKDHCFGWSTGFALMKLPKEKSPSLPPGFALFSGNSFGDIFYQEWDQKPVDFYQKTSPDEAKLKDFLNDWKQSMTSNNPVEHFKPSINNKLPINCGMIVELNGEISNKYMKPRENSFDETQVNNLVYHRVKSALKPLPVQLDNLNYFDSDFSKKIISVWEGSTACSQNVAHRGPKLRIENGRPLTQEEEYVLDELKDESQDPACYPDWATSGTYDFDVEEITQNQGKQTSGLFDLSLDFDGDGGGGELIIPDLLMPEEGDWQDVEIDDGWQDVEIEDDEDNDDDDGWEQEEDSQVFYEETTDAGLKTNVEEPSTSTSQSASSSTEHQILPTISPSEVHETKISTDSDASIQKQPAPIRSRSHSVQSQVSQASFSRFTPTTLDEQLVAHLFPAQLEVFNVEEDNEFLTQHQYNPSPAPSDQELFCSNLDPETEAFASFSNQRWS